MLKHHTKSIILSLTTATALLLVGCGGSDTDSTQETTSTISGQLTDSYVEGASYFCEDGKSGLTGRNGEFTCNSLPVSFSVGKVKIGEISELAEDKHVFPQDLVGVEREDLDNPEVLAIAQFLQSLDKDNNTANGITLDPAVVSLMPETEDFNEEDVGVYLEYAQVHSVEVDEVIEHLQGTMDSLEVITNSTLPVVITDALTSVEYELTDEIKNELAYMGNEERLAHDVYNKLYESFPNLKQLTNIPTNSEIKHIEAVRALINKYEIDGKTLSVVDVENALLTPEADVANVAGQYDIQKIQDLYDMLIAKGEQSEIDALQVGCIIEVVDINDLDEFLVHAEDSKAQDVIDVFEFLREGSYSHYWSFNDGLQNIGVAEGCCSLGDEYCKTEDDYPRVDHGNEETSTTQTPDTNATGQGKQHGK